MSRGKPSPQFQMIQAQQQQKQQQQKVEELAAASSQAQLKKDALKETSTTSDIKNAPDANKTSILTSGVGLLSEDELRRNALGAGAYNKNIKL